MLRVRQCSFKVVSYNIVTIQQWYIYSCHFVSLQFCKTLSLVSFVILQLLHLLFVSLLAFVLCYCFRKFRMFINVICICAPNPPNPPNPTVTLANCNEKMSLYILWMSFLLNSNYFMFACWENLMREKICGEYALVFVCVRERDRENNIQNKTNPYSNQFRIY